MRECEALFLDSIALARRAIYIESQYFTNEKIAAALGARLSRARRPRDHRRHAERVSWLDREDHDGGVSGRRTPANAGRGHAREASTGLSGRVAVARHSDLHSFESDDRRRRVRADWVGQLLAPIDGGRHRMRRRGRGARRRRRSRGHPADSRSAARRTSGHHPRMSSRTTSSVRVPCEQSWTHGRTPTTRSRGSSCRPSRRNLRRQRSGPPPTRTNRSHLGEAVEQLIPAVDASSERSPLRIWILPAIVLAAAAGVAWTASTRARTARASGVPGPADDDSAPAVDQSGSARPCSWSRACCSYRSSSLPWPQASSSDLCAAASSRDGLARGSRRRVRPRTAIGPSGLSRWMSGRSYRSVGQLRTQGFIGVVALRLASVASAGSIHLLCGAWRVPFTTYLAGSAIGLAPAIAALCVLGGAAPPDAPRPDRLERIRSPSARASW